MPPVLPSASTVVNVALPTLQRELAATAASVQWVVQAYSLMLASLILVGGSLGDRLGRRKIFLVGTVLFTLASAWCGVAPNLEQLIAARALQGVGGALLVPGSLAIISATFPESERGKAIGTWSGFTAITSAVGPVLGGWLVEHLSWRAVFFMNIPLAIVVVVAALWHVPESRDVDATAAVDWLGAALITIGLGGLVFGFTEASVQGWGALTTVAALAVGVLAMMGFVITELRIASPMVPFDLFRSPTFSGANLLTFFLYASLSGALYFVPFNLIQVQGYSSTQAGAALLPMVLLLFGLSRWAGSLIDHFGARLPLILGPLIAAVGFALFALPSVGGSYWVTVFPAIVVLGIGMSITVAPLTTAVMTAVDERHSGLASGINNAVSRAAGVLAIAVFGILMAVAVTFNQQLDDRIRDLPLDEGARVEVHSNRDQLAALPVLAGLDSSTAVSFADSVDRSFVAGYRLIMLAGAALAVASAVAAALLIRNPVRKPEG
ncbi:MAG: MFS transporter [Thermomicrobiales bacterium]